MTDNSQIEDELNGFGQELGTRPALAERVLATTAHQSEPTKPGSRTFAIRLSSWRSVAVSGVVIATAIVAIIVSSRPETLYGRAIQALRKARTIHVTGWTRQVLRQWPLEKPAEVTNPKQKYPVEAWYWTNGGTSRAFERFGPVIQVRNGDQLFEYQKDTNLLFVRKGASKDYVERLSELAQYLKTLELEGVETEKLGERKDGDRSLNGVRMTRHGRVDEFWFDANTSLPVRFTRSTKRDGELLAMLEMNVRVNETVPSAVVEYQPPKTENIRYGGGHKDVQLAWRQHVQAIGQRLHNELPDGSVTLIPRPEGKLFAHQWRLDTPDGRYHVYPIDRDEHFPLDIYHFVRLTASRPGTEFGIEYWRVPNELQEIKFDRQDLVVRKGTPRHEWIQSVLNQLGFEFVDVVENHSEWIAQHDGRRLKPWKEVKPPVPYLVRNGKTLRGVVRPGIGFKLVPVSMQELFRDLTELQNKELHGTGPIVIDKTQLPTPPDYDELKHESYPQYRKTVMSNFRVATDSPWFAGEKSRAMARQWYADEFGITFNKELRPRTIHVVRRKKRPADAR